MNNEKLLGKWEDLKFSYDFQKNNTVELYWKDKNITEKGIYSIEENILNLKYGKGDFCWFGSYSFSKCFLSIKLFIINYSTRFSEIRI